MYGLNRIGKSVGSLNVQNVLINDHGDIGVISQYVMPGQKSNY